MSVIVFRQVPFEHLGYLQPVLAESSLAVQLQDAHSPPVSREQVEQAAGVIVLGGPMSANDPDPFLRHQLQMLEIALTKKIPVLGICLGSQLLAKAAGSRVYRNRQKEIGFFDIQLTPQGQQDPLLGQMEAGETVFHWHSDTFDLPAEATLLASSNRTNNQAFRLDTFAYGLQFHPEVTPTMIAEWCLEDVNCGDMKEVKTPFHPNTNSKRLKALAAVLFHSWIQLALRRTQ